MCLQQQPKSKAVLLFLGRAGSPTGALMTTSSFPQPQGVAPACALGPLLTVCFEPLGQGLLLPPASIASLFFFFPSTVTKGPYASFFCLIVQRRHLSQTVFCMKEVQRQLRTLSKRSEQNECPKLDKPNILIHL